MAKVDVDALLMTGEASEADLADAVIRNHFSKLYAFATSLLGGSDDADDAVQETILKAIRSIDRYQVGTNFDAWVFAICANTCRTFFRRRKAISALKSVLQVRQRPASSSPEELAMVSERDAALWESIDMLDEKYRVPIVLKVVLEIPARLARVRRLPAAKR